MNKPHGNTFQLQLLRITVGKKHLKTGQQIFQSFQGGGHAFRPKHFWGQGMPLGASLFRTA